MRSLWHGGSANLTSLQKTLKLPFEILASFFQELRQQQFVEVKQTVGHDYTFTLTNSGRSQAAARMKSASISGRPPSRSMNTNGS